MQNRKVQLHGARSATAPAPPSLRAMRLLFRTGGAVTPALFGYWAYRLWFRSRRFPEAVDARQAARDAHREQLPLEFTRVAVYRWGEGPAVWFIHGWSGRGSQVAGFIAPLRQAGFQVLALDLPGHGESSGHSTNVIQCTDALLAMQQRFGPPAAIIAHSFGGMVLAHALTQGLQARRVVCFCPPADAQFLVDGFARTLHMHERAVRAFRRRVEQHFGNNYWDRISMVNNARRLVVPALLVHDEQDSRVPLAQSEKVVAAWRGARLLRTRGLGHRRLLRHAETIAAAVDFIRDGRLPEAAV